MGQNKKKNKNSIKKERGIKYFTYLCFSMIFALLSMVEVNAGDNNIDLSIAYGGAAYLAGQINYEHRIDRIGIGTDIWYIQQGIGTIDQKSYAGWLYLSKNIAGDTKGESKLNIELRGGFGTALSDYGTAMTDLVLSPNIGIKGRYDLTRRINIDADITIFIYQDGISMPYRFGINYTIKKVDIGIGVQGLTNMVTGKGGATTLSTGVMLKLKL